MGKRRRFDVDTTLTFGKHRGNQLQWLLKNDPGYLVWMYENIEDAEWTDDAEALVTEAIDIVAEERQQQRDHEEDRFSIY